MGLFNVFSFSISEAAATELGVVCCITLPGSAIRDLPDAIFIHFLQAVRVVFSPHSSYFLNFIEWGKNGTLMFFMCSYIFLPHS